MTRILQAKEKVKESAKKFNAELKKSISAAMITAFGLLIALVWRDVITGYVNKITSLSPIQGLLINALIVTIVCVIAIMLITKFFSSQ